MELNEISAHAVDAGMMVHTALGPGLLESAYSACLAFELRSRGLQVRTEVPIPLHYKGVQVDVGYRIDLLVEEAVIVELKAVTKLQEIHEAKLLSHLRISHLKLGLLMNFHELHLKDGIKRMVNRI